MTTAIDSKSRRAVASRFAISGEMLDWFVSGSLDELRDGAAWLQDDARYVYAAAAKYRDEGKRWVAAQVQLAAAHSAALALAALEVCLAPAEGDRDE
jgi:hypothetical protein